MTELRDGFLYHPDESASQLERLLAGEHNTEYDGLFSTTISEINSDLAEAERARGKLLEQLAKLRKRIVNLREHRGEVQDAVEVFEQTGEIAPVLIPACHDLIAKEKAALKEADAPTKQDEIQKARDDLAKDLTEGWQVSDARADDEYVYFTLKRRRSVEAPERPIADEVAAGIIEKVRAAFEKYGTDFLNRAPPIRLMAVPANPRASP